MNLPNAENATLDEIQAAIRCSSSPRSKVRLQAIKALILGIERSQVEALFDTNDRTLRRWVEAWNIQGIDGLIEGLHPGRPRIIKEEQAEHLVGFLEQPETADEVHWTAVKFHGFVQKKLELELSYSTVLRFIHERRFSLQVPQPYPDRGDEELRKAFCNKLKMLSEDEEIEIWFQDEMGVEGDPRPRRRWAPVGQKARVVKNGDHVRMNVIGMVCPRTGEAYMLEFPHCDGEIFQVFLNEANKDLELKRKRQILIMDNASWHKLKSLNWGRFEPLFLPPYSPDLNPIERLWLVIKANWFTDYICKTREALEQRLDEALKWAIKRGKANRQTCPIRTEI